MHERDDYGFGEAFFVLLADIKKGVILLITSFLTCWRPKRDATNNMCIDLGCCTLLLMAYRLQGSNKMRRLARVFVHQPRTTQRLVPELHTRNCCLDPGDQQDIMAFLVCAVLQSTM